MAVSRALTKTNPELANLSQGRWRGDQVVKEKLDLAKEALSRHLTRKDAEIIDEDYNSFLP